MTKRNYHAMNGACDGEIRYHPQTQRYEICIELGVTLTRKLLKFRVLSDLRFKKPTHNFS